MPKMMVSYWICMYVSNLRRLVTKSVHEFHLVKKMGVQSHRKSLT